AEVALGLELVDQRRDLLAKLGQAAAVLEGLGVADQGPDAEAGHHQEGHGRDDQDGDQLRPDAPVAQADRPTGGARWRRRCVHTGGFTTSLARCRLPPGLYPAILPGTVPTWGSWEKMTRMRLLSRMVLAVAVLSVAACTASEPESEPASVSEGRIGGLRPPAGKGA